MPTRPLEALVRHVRRIAGASEPDPIGDADLVARFTVRRDQAAFAEIVQRHGPLVWAIDKWHQPMYRFPRDCPRILLWPRVTTTAKIAAPTGRHPLA